MLALSIPAATVIAAAVAAIPGVVAAILAHRANVNSGAASWAAGATLGAIGPRNGETVTELLRRLAELEGYQHTRNHDVLTGLQKLQLLAELTAQAHGIDLRDLPTRPGVFSQTPLPPPSTPTEPPG